MMDNSAELPTYPHHGDDEDPLSPITHSKGLDSQFAPHVVAAFNRAIADGSFRAEARAPRWDDEVGSSDATEEVGAAKVLSFPPPHLAPAGRAGSARASASERVGG